MFYFTVFLVLQAATFIHGDFQARTILVEKVIDNFGVMRVGKSKQRMKTFFDTGSNYMWVVSAEKPVGKVKVGSIEPNLPFKVSASTTFVNIGTKGNEQYMKGEITGYLAKDNIKISAIPVGIDMGLTEFGVVESSTVDVGPNILSANGVLFGLNLVSRELIPDEPTSSLETFVKKTPVFGFYNKVQEKYLVYGKPDEDLISGPFSTHDVVKIGDKYNGWNVKITKFMVEKGNEKKEFKSEAVKYGQVITGNGAVLVGPKELFKQIIEYIYRLASITNWNLYEGYSFPCEYDTYEQLLAKIPVLSVFIDDVKMDIEPKYFILRHAKSNKCYCLLGAADIGYVKIGSGFIAKYYTQFDYNNKQVSFALAEEPAVMD